MIKTSKFKCGGKKAVKLVKNVIIVISDVSTIYLWKKNDAKLVCRANRLLLVKCYDNKKVKSPYNWVISPLTQSQVANKQTNKNCNLNQLFDSLEIEQFRY